MIVQFGGQTPLKLARALEAAGVPIVGTTPDAIDRAEERERFQQMIDSSVFYNRVMQLPVAQTRLLSWQKKLVIRWLFALLMCWVAAPWKSSTKKTSCVII